MRPFDMMVCVVHAAHVAVAAAASATAMIAFFMVDLQVVKKRRAYSLRFRPD
jgi:hypothetical protein